MTQKIQLETIAKSSYGGRATKGCYVIQTADEWKMFFEDNASIDFSRETVFVAYLGCKPTGGYSIAIEEAIETERSIDVYVREYPRKRGSIVTQAITTPYHMVKAPKMRKEVVFHVNTLDYCAASKGNGLL
ncbi:protease complex subunit PrcB family protein [Candidatus Woesearchaeota archaeon]|nr:protease complex subunit PrcB family protein [Candidatus Woesearchaeota archaeon]